MKGEAYAPNIYHYLLMTWLACDQLRAYFLCHNYVSVFYHKSGFYSWQIQRFSKSGGWLTHLRQHKTSIFSLLCQCHETQLQLECLRAEDTLCLWGLPILPIRIGSQVKTRCESYKFKEFAKSSFFFYLDYMFQATHFLNLVDKLCKMKWIRWALLKIQADKLKPVYPTPTSLHYDIQIVLPLWSAQVLMANDAHYLIYVYIYILHHGPQTRC